MNRYPDPQVLLENARALRREALAGMAGVAAIKWRAFRRSSPCPAPAPSRHPASLVMPNA